MTGSKPDLDPGAYIGHEPELEAQTIPGGVTDRDERTSAYDSRPGVPGEPLGPDDEGIGSVRPEETEPLDPTDEGVGNVRPEDTEPLHPTDEGVGSVRPEETEPLAPGDEGVGSVRP